MPITEKQREQRKKYIGASDAPAIIGVDHFRNIADVYLSKVQELAGQKETAAQKAGNLCENAVLNWFMDETGSKIKRNQRRVHKNGIMAANIDALVIGNKEGVEAKTTGITGPVNPDEWGEPGTDEVPDRVIAQCQHQMAVVPDLTLVWVPALIGGVGFKLYKIERNNEFIAGLEDILLSFWHDHVLKKIPPANNIPSLSLLKRIRRVPNKVTSIDSNIVKAWNDAKADFNKAKKNKEQVEQVLIDALGDAEAGDCDIGRVTYFEQSRKEYTVQATTYRVARYKQSQEVSL